MTDSSRDPVSRWSWPSAWLIEALGAGGVHSIIQADRCDRLRSNQSLSRSGGLTRRWASQLCSFAIVWLTLSLFLHEIASASEREIPLMNGDVFWEIVEPATRGAQESQAFAILRRQLESLSDEELVQFEIAYQLFHSQADQGDVWAAGVLLNGGHGSDDGFSYFRNWLILRGRQTYQKALQEPDSLASVSVTTDTNGRPSAQWESLGSVASFVFETRTGKDLFDMLGQRRAKSGWGDLPDWDWASYTNEVIQARLPRLWHQYGKYKVEFDKLIGK